MFNREFNIKNFVVIFISLSFLSIFLFYSSTITTNVYNEIFAEETFNKGVAVGSISIGDTTRVEAIALVKERVTKWQNENPVFFMYNDQKVQLPPETWLFQPEESIQCVSGTANKLYVELNENSIESSISHLKVTGLEDLLDKEMLFAHLKKLGSELQTNHLEIDISEFLTTFGQAKEVVSEGTLKLPGEHVLLDEWIKGLNGYELKPGRTFSLIQAIEEVSLTAQDSIDLNVLASAIYSAVQKTNFMIVERHTSRELPEYTSLGYEAFVKPADMDFAFQNPNATSYKLEFLIDENKNLIASIVGVPLPYTYTVKVDKQVFKPKTIIHFNDQLASILSSVVVNGGSEGYLATIYRQSFGSGGEAVDTIKLAEDFYPPKHRIEERGYPVEEEEAPETTTPENGTLPYPYPGYPYLPYPYDPNNPVVPGIPGNADPSPTTPQEPPPQNETNQKDAGQKNATDRVPPNDDGKKKAGETK
ncbi:VanW family protein [Fictibacillus halophilus]|uniref:VanW family protein n=1 Tax=Fictibacillus halophilus TaxID=1610490 RepID=UPI001CFB043B|nr:VanW family protein [Fictibacillus halophilus]